MEVRDLRFSEWPMFNRVMEDNPEVCRMLLEAILDEPIGGIGEVTVEKAIEPRLGAKGVRLDVFIKGSGK
ncbi:hypothetical protein PZH32_13495, partial [Adlercreutzia equolifaciens]|uniref:hypothetical protein n=1 Tax=Adlercreutzia equolifaciens TaxID=446660 RepID=UPI0023B064BD